MIWSCAAYLNNTSIKLWGITLNATPAKKPDTSITKAKAAAKPISFFLILEYVPRKEITKINNHM